MAKLPETYRKEITKLRAGLPQAKTRRTAHAINERIRQLAAIMSGRRSGEWHDIPLADAERITGERGA
jgi:hypothetical protein